MKAQTTIFIVLGILLVSFIGIFYFLNFEKTEKNENKESVLHFYIGDCLEEKGLEAVDFIASSGGYYKIPEKSTDFGIVYYENFPEKKILQKQTELYLNEKFLECINYSIFPEYEVKQGEVESKVIIEKEKVNFKINYPVSVKKGNSSYSYEGFEREVYVRLGLMHDIAREIYQGSQDGVCMGCMYDSAKNNSLEINAVSINPETIVYSVRDNKTIISENEFTYNFAVKYE